MSKLPTFLPPLLLLIALGVALTMAYRLWGEMHEDAEPVTDAEVLSELEQAHEAGEIDDAEMTRVLALLDPSKAHPSPSSTSRAQGQVSPTPPPEVPPSEGTPAPPSES